MRRAQFLISLVVAATIAASSAMADPIDAEMDSLSLRSKLLEEQTSLLKKYLPPESARAIDELDKAWVTYRDAVCTAESALGLRVRDVGDPAAQDDARRQCIARMSDNQRNQINRYMEQYIQTRTAQEQQQRRQEKQQADAAARDAACKLPVASQDFDVLAVGTYKGFKQLDVPIGKFSMMPQQADVVVNSPKKPVVLVLMAYDPTVWNRMRRSSAWCLPAITSRRFSELPSRCRKSRPSMTSAGRAATSMPTRLAESLRQSMSD